MTVDQVFKILVSGDIVAVLAVILILGFLGQWVYGWTYKSMVKDRDEWKEVAQKAVETADRLTEIMESAKRGK